MLSNLGDLDCNRTSSSGPGRKESRGIGTFYSQKVDGVSQDPGRDCQVISAFSTDGGNAAVEREG